MLGDFGDALGGAVGCMAMRRLLRILLSAATVLSLVLCAVTLAAWVRSYQVNDIVYWSWANPRLELRILTCRAGFFASVFRPVGNAIYLHPPGVEWEPRFPMGFAELHLHYSFFNRFGFALDHRQNGAYATRELACPYWFITVLLAILPGARLCAWRRRARRLRMRPGFCRVRAFRGTLVQFQVHVLLASVRRALESVGLGIRAFKVEKASACDAVGWQFDEQVSGIRTFGILIDLHSQHLLRAQIVESRDKRDRFVNRHLAEGPQ